MRRETAAAAVNVELGDVSVNVQPPTAGTVKERTWETNQVNLVLPAGAYSVHVSHVDPAGGQFTANGEPITFNRYYERQTRRDEVNNRQDFTPEVTIANPDARTIRISVSYPSSSNVNPNLL